MEDEIIIEEVEFSEELYQKNIQEHDFSNKITDGKGEDVNENS